MNYNSTKNTIKKLVLKSNSLLSKFSWAEKNYVCPICSSHLHTFDRLPNFYHQKLTDPEFIFSLSQFETLNSIQYGCPTCGSSDRDRLSAMYFQREMPQVSETFSFLDIAPAKVLRDLIKFNYPQAQYRSADLMMEDVDDKVDITQMDTYNDNTFDFFMCSHVLEHIPEDRKAMSELHRILKPGGKGIAMVPIMLSLDEDYENPEITTPEGRWKHFGQDDHIRMYSKNGFVDKLTDAGFKVNQLDIDFFGSDTFTKYGIHPHSVLYIAEKLS